MRLIPTVALVALAACGRTEDPGAGEVPTEVLERPAVFDPLTDALDTAYGVEETLRESAGARRRQLEAAEGR